MRQILPILIVIFVLATSCVNSQQSVTTTSSEARVSAFTFQKDTANPGLTSMAYKIEHRADTGLIYCKDSLPFGTRLDSVIPIVSYMATPGWVSFKLPDTTITSTGADTIDFTKKPIYLHITASDMITEKVYQIDISAHQANPDLYVWDCLTENLFAPAKAPHCETKAFYWKGEIVVLVNDGLSTRIYQSTNGKVWEEKAQSVESLPVPCHVRDIVQCGDMLYYIDEDALYQSGDLYTWSKTELADVSYRLVNMLMTYDEKAWCILQDKTSGGLMLGVVKGESVEIETQIQGLENGILPSGFPISDFAAIEFKSSSERARAMIVGGIDINGETLNSRWNIEYAPNTGYRMKNFSIAQPTFASLNGASIIQYNDHLIMFGGTDNDMDYHTDMLYSKDEGMNWYMPDSANNQLPESYQSRSHQSVLVDEEKNIYIIGGQSHLESYSDVYCGFLNSSKWE